MYVPGRRRTWAGDRFYPCFLLMSGIALVGVFVVQVLYEVDLPLALRLRACHRIARIDLFEIYDSFRPKLSVILSHETYHNYIYRDFYSGFLFRG